MVRQISDTLLRDVSRGFVRGKVEIANAKTGEVILSTDPTSPAPRVLVVGGRLINDEARNYPGSGTLEIMVDDATMANVIPITGSDPLAPVSPTYAQVSFHARDEPEVDQPYGRYEISRADLSVGNDGAVLSVEMFDNSRKVDNARFWRPDQFGPAAYQLILEHLLIAVLPVEKLVFEQYPWPLGLHSWDAQDSRLTAVNEIVTSVGFQIDWNYNGVGDIHVWSNPDVNTDPNWSFVEGADLRIVAASRELSDEKAYNGVIASGESTSNGTPPVVAEAWDRNVSSPTYFDPSNPGASVYGPKPFFYVSKFIATQRQAQDAADARLPSVLGMTEVITFETLPNPGIIPGDVVEIERENIGLKGLYTVSSVDMPLTTSSMMLVTCRERRPLGTT